MNQPVAMQHVPDIMCNMALSLTVCFTVKLQGSELAPNRSVWNLVAYLGFKNIKHSNYSVYLEARLHVK